MIFKSKTGHLKHWLSKAATSLGGTKATQSIHVFVFGVEDGFVRVVCANNISYSVVLTQIHPEGDEEPFAVDAQKLQAVLGYADDNEVLKLECDGKKVLVSCGDYIGAWELYDLKEFPKLPAFEHGQPRLVQIQSFCRSIEQVKYAAEGVANRERRVVFRDGVCWGASNRRYQQTNTGFEKEVDIVLPFLSLGVVKFLELSETTDTRDFSYAVSDSFQFFSVGTDVFICPRGADSPEYAEKSDWESRYDKDKGLYFEKESGVLFRSIIMASATCEKNSSVIHFEFEPEKLYILGDDRHGNTGVVSLDVKINGAAKNMKKVRSVGWHWLIEAIQSTTWKSCSVLIDNEVLIIESEKAKAVMTLESLYNVQRTIAGKSSE